MSITTAGVSTEVNRTLCKREAKTLNPTPIDPKP